MSQESELSTLIDESISTLQGYIGRLANARSFVGNEPNTAVGMVDRVVSDMKHKAQEIQEARWR